MPKFRAIGATAWLQAVLVLAIGWFYFWTAAPEWHPGLIAAQDAGYYNLLVRGFLKGHLYLDARADPFLATLANPWDPSQRGNHGMPDATYFQGRYYIYYGVSPVVLLFLPFRLLTGKFISETLATPIFACAGLIASAWLLLAVRRRYFPRTSAALVAACILALGLADMMPVLLRRSGFREVPITCGYACCMLALAAIYQALHHRRPAPWLALASAAFGFAVGSRPLYLLACPTVLLPVWLAARARGFGLACWRDRDWRKLALAAMAPMAAIGFGLALYNELRFGRPTEFGLRYQIWLYDSAKVVYFSWSYLAYNLRAYWLAPAGWSHYFPYVTFAKLPAAPPGHYGAEDPYGILPNMPFALFALVGCIFAARKSAEPTHRLRIVCASVAATAIAMALPLLFLMAALNRYMLDFTPSVILLACLGLLTVSAQSWFRGRAATIGTLVACSLSCYSSGFNVLASLRHNELFHDEYPALYHRIAYRWNWISYEYDRWHHIQYGPVEMKVIFPAGRVGSVEPLVVTGHSFLSDYLFVHYLGPDSVRFGLDHTSRETLVGQPVRAVPGQVHTLRIDLGSLYPPAGHPYFDSMSPAEARLRQDTVRVTLDGQIALNRTEQTYDAAGPVPSIGTAGDRPGFAQAFSGQILSWRRMPDATFEQLGGGYGPFRLQLKFPPFSGVRNEPLVCVGETGRGDLVYVHYESPSRVSLGYDHWGVGGPVSSPITVDPLAVQVIEIDFGALHPPLPGDLTVGFGPALRGHLQIRLNGQTALDEQDPYYPVDPATVAVGSNPIQTSTASATFTGDLVKAERRPEP